MEKHITRDMTIEEILSLFPQKAPRLAQEMKNMGLNCIGCSQSVWETIEAGVLGHGHSEENLVLLLDKLNQILNEPLNDYSISMTKKAAKKFLEILEEEKKVGWALRFGDRAGGCQGFEYLLDYSEKASPEDKIFYSEGVEIHVHSGAVPRLMGSIIDYVDGLQGGGFKISNPHVKSSCHCGKSQNY